MYNATVGIEWEPQFTLLKYPRCEVHFVRKDSFDYRSRASEGQLVTLDWSPMISTCRYESDFTDLSTSIYIVLGEGYYPSYYDAMSSYYFEADASVQNAEVRTRPVNLDILTDHMEFCTNYLSHFVEDLSVFSPAGVFLPVSVPIFLNRSAPSKHVSVSFQSAQGYSKIFEESTNDMWSWFTGWPISVDYDKLANFRTSMKVKLSSVTDISYRRLHITVPYNFTDYAELTKFAFFVWSEKDPEILKIRMMDLAVYLDYWDLQHKQKDPILICHTNGKNKVKIVNNLF